MCSVTFVFSANGRDVLVVPQGQVTKHKEQNPKGENHTQGVYIVYVTTYVLFIHYIVFIEMFIITDTILPFTIIP